MQLIALFATAALSTVVSAVPALERRAGAQPATSTSSSPVPTGTNNPPDVPTGSDTDPLVTYYHPDGTWIDRRVNDPTNLLNGNYIVQRINGNGICSDWWTVLYKVTGPADYPVCNTNVGFFNNGNQTNNTPAGHPPQANYQNLQFGQCPRGVYSYLNDFWHPPVDKYNTWNMQFMYTCWAGWSDQGGQNDGNTATYTFPNGMKVGWCCMKADGY